MNNEDFRKLVQSTPRAPAPAREEEGSWKRKYAALGSRAKSSVQMTPRGSKAQSEWEFAQQLREQRAGKAAPQKSKPAKQYKGLKLGDGYVDRAQARREAKEDDDSQEQIQALQAQHEAGTITTAEFASKFKEIQRGGSAPKGLHSSITALENRDAEPAEDSELTEQRGHDAMDDELDELERATAKPVEREEKLKQGVMAPPPKPLAGTKRTRADLLAELKASRKAAEEEQAAQMAKGFQRVGAGQKQPDWRIERDDQGREVLITVDANGKVKRKVRKTAQPPVEPPVANKAPVTQAEDDPPIAPISKSEPAKEAPEEDDGLDMFGGTGDDYELFANQDDDSDDSDESSDGSDEADEAEKEDESRPPAKNQKAAKPAQPPAGDGPRKSYFQGISSASRKDEPQEDRGSGMGDPEILVAMQRAAKIRRAEEEAEQTADSSLSKHRLLQNQGRDFDDMDMDFGASRGGDDEDADDFGRAGLSEWKGIGAEDDDEDGNDGKRGGQKQRKRGKKKKKGDKNSAADVMRVLEGRKK